MRAFFGRLACVLSVLFNCFSSNFSAKNSFRYKNFFTRANILFYTYFYRFSHSVFIGYYYYVDTLSHVCCIDSCSSGFYHFQARNTVYFNLFGIGCNNSLAIIAYFCLILFYKVHTRATIGLFKIQTRVISRIFIPWVLYIGSIFEAKCFEECLV